MKAHVGLEIHIRLNSETKIFCSCSSRFGSEANSNVCPVCLGYPGTLPLFNACVMRLGCMVAKALHSEIPDSVRFERKNYFYPDLSKNYQISQYASPMGRGGYFLTRAGRKIRIREAHLEEDAGKMIHAGDASYCDYNRAGTPLLEVVTEPDLHSGEEVEAMLQEFRRTVQYLGACDGNMEEGSMRCDVNVSVSADDELGTKVEIKNLNSFRFVRLAANYEISRQTALVEAGTPVTQETRQWNEHRDRTEAMRSKEDVHDYRYFSEPDLPLFPVHDSLLNEVARDLPELPNARQDRLEKDYHLPQQMASAMTETRALADFFEETVALGSDAKTAGEWLYGDVRRTLHKSKTSLEESFLTPLRLHQLIDLLQSGAIQRRIAQRVLGIVVSEDVDPLTVVEERNWKRIQDEALLRETAAKVLAQHEVAASEFLEGKEQAADYLFGEMMKLTEGRADPKLGMKSLRTLLQERRNR